MKLEYTTEMVTFEYAQRDLTFTLDEENRIKASFCDGNETDKNGNMFRRDLYMNIEEQKALKKLIKKSIKKYKHQRKQ